jgi:hypothetical protein
LKLYNLVGYYLSVQLVTREVIFEQAATVQYDFKPTLQYQVNAYKKAAISRLYKESMHLL